MKKLLLVASLLSTVTAFALPANTSDLVLALQNNSAFVELLEKHKGYEELRIERVSPMQKLRKRCETQSKSASILRVSFVQKNVSSDLQKGSIDYYFGTNHSPKDLTLCL